MEVVIPVRKSNRISGFIVSSKSAKNNEMTTFTPCSGLNEKDPEIIKLINNFNGTSPSPYIVGGPTTSGTQDHIFNSVFGQSQYPNSYQAHLLAGSRECDKISEQSDPILHALVVPGKNATRSYEEFEFGMFEAINYYRRYNDEYAIGVALHQFIDAFLNVNKSNCMFNVYKHRIDITVNPSMKVWYGPDAKDVYIATSKIYRDLKSCYKQGDIWYVLRPWTIAYLTPKGTIIWSTKSNITL